MEYWRWWVVHLWVEGFFEVFATLALAFIFTQLGIVRAMSATRAVHFSSAIYLFGGIPGTFHHLYFSGTPISITAIGATFSALEVVPLALIGYEAWETYQKSHAVDWMEKYRWPIRSFMGVAFWNLVGAGIFGFLINPPIALWYARSADFLQLPVLETLRWLRMVGDTVFFVGVFMLTYFETGLITGWPYMKDTNGQRVAQQPTA